MAACQATIWVFPVWLCFPGMLAALPPLYVYRSGGHSGSNWLSEVLARTGWSVFFQFGGLCDGKPETGWPNASAARTKDALVSLWARGCRCGAGRLFDCNAYDQPNCKKSMPFCSASSCTSPCTATSGVAIVAPPIKLHSEALWLAFAANPHARLVTWTRTNVVKHALSRLKSECDCMGIANHGTAEDKALAKQRPCFVHMPAEKLIAKSADQARHIRDINEVIGQSAAFHLTYEEMQQDVSVIANMLDALNATARRLSASNARGGKQKKLIKVAGEDLSTILLDFTTLAVAFAPWPCLYKQLLSTKVERFEPCVFDQQEWRAVKNYRMARNNSDLSAAAVKAWRQRQRDMFTLKCDGTSWPSHAKTVLCSAAVEKRRSLLGTSGPVDVCLLHWSDGA